MHAPRLTALLAILTSWASWASACGGDDADTGGDTSLADTGTGGDSADGTALGDAPLFDTLGPDTGDTRPPDGGGEIVQGAFGAPCQGNLDCLDGYCVEGPEGFICTRECIDECPESFDCRSVVSSSADVVFLCLPRVDKVCIPCKSDY